MRKINFLVVVVFIISFILIVNAVEEKANIVLNESPNLNNQSNITNELQVNINSSGKAVTDSFGVYLQIVI